MADAGKRVKYASLLYDFEPLGFETSGVLGPSSKMFIMGIGSIFRQWALGPHLHEAHFCEVCLFYVVQVCI